MISLDEDEELRKKLRDVRAELAEVNQEITKNRPQRKYNDKDIKPREETYKQTKVISEVQKAPHYEQKRLKRPANQLPPEEQQCAKRRIGSLFDYLNKAKINLESDKDRINKQLSMQNDVYNKNYSDEKKLRRAYNLSKRDRVDSGTLRKLELIHGEDLIVNEMLYRKWVKYYESLDNFCITDSIPQLFYIPNYVAGEDQTPNSSKFVKNRIEKSQVRFNEIKDQLDKKLELRQQKFNERIAKREDRLKDNQMKLSPEMKESNGTNLTSLSNNLPPSPPPKEENNDDEVISDKDKSDIDM